MSWAEVKRLVVCLLCVRVSVGARHRGKTNGERHGEGDKEVRNTRSGAEEEQRGPERDTHAKTSPLHVCVITRKKG